MPGSCWCLLLVSLAWSRPKQPGQDEEGRLEGLAMLQYPGQEEDRLEGMGPGLEEESRLEGLGRMARPQQSGQEEEDSLEGLGRMGSWLDFMFSIKDMITEVTIPKTYFSLGPASRSGLSHGIDVSMCVSVGVFVCMIPPPL